MRTAKRIQDESQVITPVPTLRYYQEEAVAGAWDTARQGESGVVVLPTGAGKSIVIAELCRQAVMDWKGRCMVLAHRKELVEQNAQKVQLLMPNVPVGMYSAGLKKKDRKQAAISAGIQSVYKRAHDFGPRQVLNSMNVIASATTTPLNIKGSFLIFAA